jgi:hypothetical protein
MGYIYINECGTLNNTNALQQGQKGVADDN